MARKTSSPEARLAAHWRRRSGLPWSDFDAFADKQPPPGITGRSQEKILTEAKLRLGATPFGEVVRDLALTIFHGLPLNYFEYHLAVACGLLLADGIPYEEFFRKHWFETAENRGYGRRPRHARPAVRG